MAGGVDVATLGLRVDSDGAVIKVKSLYGELKQLGVAGTQVEGRLKSFSTQGVLAFSNLAAGGNRDITSVLRSMTNLGFAFGAGVGTITLAISSIASMWTESRRQSKEEQEKMMADLLKMEHEFSNSAKRMRITALESRLNQLFDETAGRGGRDVSAGQQGWGDIATNWKNMFRQGEITKEIEQIIGRLGALHGELLEVAQAAAAADLRVVTDVSEQVKGAEKWAKFQSEMAGRNAADDRRDADAEAARIQHVTSLKADAARRQMSFIDELRRRQKEASDEAIAQAKKEAAARKDVIQQIIQQIKILGSAFAGAVTGMLQGQGGIVGAIGDMGAGALAGAGGGAPGIAMGAMQGLTSGLIAMASAARAAREQARRLTEAYGDFIAAVKTQLGDMSSTEKAIRDVRREFGEMRRQMNLSEEAIAAFDKMVQFSDADIAAMRAELGRLNELERRRIEQIQGESSVMQEVEARRQIEMQQDIEVRRLRALGMDEQAEALAFALAQQREYAQAVRDGADATTRSALAEVQRQEAISKAMAQIQARIDSFSATISGLQDFQNALKLGDASISPTAKLAEATRQYQEIVNAAMGGDQAAAGRLPAAAQAFLDASRAVNASGPAFQADFLKVLTDTQAAIDKFTDLKTIEELMLEELKAIRGNTEPREIGDVNPNVPIGTIPTVDIDPLINVSQDGFRQTIDRLETLTLRVEALTRATNDGLAGLRLQRT